MLRSNFSLFELLGAGQPLCQRIGPISGSKDMLVYSQTFPCHKVYTMHCTVYWAIRLDGLLVICLFCVDNYNWFTLLRPGHKQGFIHFCARGGFKNAWGGDVSHMAMRNLDHTL